MTGFPDNDGESLPEGAADALTEAQEYDVVCAARIVTWIVHNKELLTACVFGVAGYGSTWHEDGPLDGKQQSGSGHWPLVAVAAERDAQEKRKDITSKALDIQGSQWKSGKTHSFLR